MRIASWSWGGRDSCRHDFGRRPRGHAAGRSADAGARRAAADRGAGARRIAAAAPRARGCAVEAITLRAPLPAPAAQPVLRRPQLPLARRRARRQRLSRQPARAEHAWPIVFTKLARVRDRPARPGAPARRGRLAARSTTRASSRSSSAAAGATSPRARAMDHVLRLHRSSTTSARATCRSATSSGTSARASTPSARWGRGSSPPTSSTAATRGCAAGSTASCARTAQTRDMIFDIPTLIETCSRGITLLPRRRHRHRHAGGRRHGLHAAEMAASRATWCGSRSTASARSRTGSNRRAMTLHVSIGAASSRKKAKATAVVCVHGLGGSTNTFTPLMPALARHRVVRVDLPGSGRSHRVEGPLSIERFVETLLSVCTRLNVDACALDRPLDRHHRLPARGGGGAEAGARASPCSAR